MTDNETASAAEGTLEALEAHPKLRTVGENTAGFVHFGNIAPLVLTSSGLAVLIASTHFAFADGRWVEKVGYAPQLAVPPEGDALAAALSHLSARLRLAA